MTNLFTVIEFRSHLKRYLKNQSVVVIQVTQCEPVFVRVEKVGLFTVTCSVLDIDEETWLGTEIIPIKDITAINESCINRARTKLMFEMAGPSGVQEVRDSLMGAHMIDEEEDFGCE